MVTESAGESADLPSRPRVSIGLPVYNGENFVADALESLLAQTFTDFEVIVSDNASTDDTLQIVDRFALADDRVRVVRHPKNLGAAPNFNFVVDEARGEFFRWAAHDDLCDPTYLEKCVAILDARPEVVLCHCRSLQIDADGQVKKEYPQLLRRAGGSRPLERFLELSCTKHTCIDVFGLIRTDALRRTGLIGSFTGSDRVLLGEFALRGAFAWVDEPLFKSRDHKERSIHRKLRERAQWFDTRSNVRPILMPFWRILREYNKSLGRSPLGPLGRVRARAILLRWMALNWKDLSRDLKWGILLRLRRSPKDDAPANPTGATTP